MATRNPFLVNWVKSAYSMEMGLVPLLEEQTRQGTTDAQLRQGLDQHLQKTRQHVDLLKGCLQRMGENISAIRPSNAIFSAYGQTMDGSPDKNRQTELIDFVTEAFEVASYRALSALASELGDHETSQVCEQILQDELTITQALDRRLPGQSFPARAGGQDNVALARENFDALNAHDLDRAERGFTPDYRSVAPGMAGEMDRKQGRTYIETYFKAFPDLHFDIQRSTASGDRVVVEWIGTGTHTGPLGSPDGKNIPPTGRKTRVFGTTSFECRDGKIARTQVYFDSGDLMRQLGLLPGAEQTRGTSVNRPVVHLEIPAADRQVAGRFYGDLFGWKIEHMPGEMKYTTFQTGSVAGGFPDLGEMYKPGDVILYVESPDIDSDLRRAGTMGAKTVVPKTPIPDMGWFAIFSDPTGNRIGLFTAQAM